MCRGLRVIILRMRRWMILGLLAATGCNTGLVTDYQPRRLGDSPAARRGYYATKFSPAARAAEQEREADTSRRATPPAGGGPSPY